MRNDKRRTILCARIHQLKGHSMRSSPSRASVEGFPSNRPARASSASGWLALLAASCGLFMLYVDLFIVNVALPAIGRDFHASVATASWTVTGYVLMIGVLPLGVGRLGDIWGHRAVYLVGLALFLIASFACGLAPTIRVLISSRVLHCFGPPLISPGTIAILPPAVH